MSICQLRFVIFWAFLSPLVGRANELFRPTITNPNGRGIIPNGSTGGVVPTHPFLTQALVFLFQVSRLFRAEKLCKYHPTSRSAGRTDGRGGGVAGAVPRVRSISRPGMRPAAATAASAAAVRSVSHMFCPAGGKLRSARGSGWQRIRARP